MSVCVGRAGRGGETETALQKPAASTAVQTPRLLGLQTVESILYSNEIRCFIINRAYILAEACTLNAINFAAMSELLAPLAPAVLVTFIVTIVVKLSSTPESVLTPCSRYASAKTTASLETPSFEDSRSASSYSNGDN